MTLFAVNSFLRINAADSQYSHVIANVDEELVSAVVNSIDCTPFVDSIIFDMNALYEKINNLVLALNNTHDYSSDYYIRQYKNSLVSIEQFRKSKFFSVEWKERILLWMLLFADSLSYEEVSQEFMNDRNMQSIIMLMQMAGIEFTAQQSLLAICAAVHESCIELKNDNLNDVSYEMTLYRIYEELSKKMVNDGFFEKFADFIISSGLNTLQEKIKSKQQKDSDKKLHNKKIDSKKKKK
jgi:hypothetical protein